LLPALHRHSAARHVLSLLFLSLPLSSVIPPLFALHPD
jgi:hypothetical protein